MLPPTPRAPLGACGYLAFRLRRTGSGRRDRPGDAPPRHALYTRFAGLRANRRGGPPTKAGQCPEPPRASQSGTVIEHWTDAGSPGPHARSRTRAVTLRAPGAIRARRRDDGRGRRRRWLRRCDHGRGRVDRRVGAVGAAGHARRATQTPPDVRSRGRAAGLCLFAAVSLDRRSDREGRDPEGGRIPWHGGLYDVGTGAMCGSRGCVRPLAAPLRRGPAPDR